MPFGYAKKENTTKEKLPFFIDKLSTDRVDERITGFQCFRFFY